MNLEDFLETSHRLLIQEKLTPDKQKGIEAFAKGDYQQVIASFKNSLLQQQNDPEALADYAVKTARRTKIAFCYDFQAFDNVSFKDEFLAAFLSKGVGQEICILRCVQ